MIILYKGQIGARPRSVLVGFDGSCPLSFLSSRASEEI